MEGNVDATNAQAVSDLEQLKCPFTGNRCTRKCALFTERGCAFRHLAELEGIKEQVRKYNRNNL